jgi:hypothetical protein
MILLPGLNSQLNQHKAQKEAQKKMLIAQSSVSPLKQPHFEEESKEVLAESEQDLEIFKSFLELEKDGQGNVEVVNELSDQVK